MTSTTSQHLFPAHMSIGQLGSANLGCVLLAPHYWSSLPLFHISLILQEMARLPRKYPSHVERKGCPSTNFN